ncbi:MAG TPA: DUF481 domain-containing protein [Candidatus Polarisedimenticolia bacterium]|jgi:hypothetical protein|nr:DUF481 domain-containing protein [Candidatus Polarisedimenticolia bacterium]
MRQRESIVKGIIVLAIITIAEVGAARAQDAAGKADWSDIGLLSVIVTDGNSEAWTAGIKNTLAAKGAKSMFELQTSGYQAQSTTRVRFALGPSQTDFQVVEIKSDWEAESYIVGLRFDRLMAKRMYWLIGGGWERNRLKGLKDRFMEIAGVGARWIDKDKALFRTDIAATSTRQNDVIDNTLEDNEFPGVRLSSKFQKTFSTGATIGHELVVDQNLDRTEDRRADMTAWVSFASGPHLALQMGAQLLYDWEPALQEIPRFSAPLIYSGQNVQIPFEEFDKIFTAALVLVF